MWPKSCQNCNRFIFKMIKNRERGGDTVQNFDSYVKIMDINGLMMIHVSFPALCTFVPKRTKLGWRKCRE